RVDDSLSPQRRWRVSSQSNLQCPCSWTANHRRGRSYFRSSIDIERGRYWLDRATRRSSRSRGGHPVGGIRSRRDVCKRSSCRSRRKALYVRSCDFFISASHARRHAQPPCDMIMAPIVLVTGADGFVGRHVVSALTQAGWHVRCAQRSIGPTSPTADIVTGLELGPSTNWQAALKGVHAVVHLAARAHRSKNTQQHEKDLYFSINVEGTMQL